MTLKVPKMDSGKGIDPFLRSNNSSLIGPIGLLGATRDLILPGLKTANLVKPIEAVDSG